MSARSIRRNAERAGRRRARRVAAATGAALGAGALLAPATQAANLEVNSLADGPADACDATCTLRDAVAAANASAEADAITFASALSGTIRLAAPADGGGAVQVNPADALSITDDGPAEITISGDVNADGALDNGDTRIFDINATAPVTISGLRLTGGSGGAIGGGAILVGNNAADLTIDDSELTGNGQASPGGAILINAGDVEINDSVLSGNVSAIDGGGGGGGAISINADNALTISDSELSDNYALSGGAIAAFGDQVKYGPGSYGPSLVPEVTIEGSTLADNGSDGVGGALHASAAKVELVESDLTGNVARVNGGAINSAKYTSLDLEGTTITGNEAGGTGGAVAFNGQAGKYDDLDPATTISDSTIADNAAISDGGGLSVYGLGVDDSLLVESSTLSGNESEARGGAMKIVGVPGLPPPPTGPVDIVDSTISGNAAAKGGGAMLGEPGVALSPNDSVDFSNSTIAGNDARDAGGGGGLYLAAYDTDPDGAVTTLELGTVNVYSSVAGDNSAGDLASAPASGGDGFIVGYSLVENPGTASYSSSPTGTNLVGDDPALLPLGDFGGPTETQAPANSSPVIDAGANPLTLASDQRGEPRTTDLPPANPNDGTDMGAVELQAIAAPNTRIDSGPDGRFVVRSSTVTFRFSADQPGSTFECSLDGGAFEPCTSPRQLTGLSNGAHTFAVRATSDGIADPTPATATFTVDTSGPPDIKPPVTTVDKAPKRKIKTSRGKAKVKVAFSSNEPESTFQCKIDKGVFKACQSPLTAKLKAKTGKGAKHSILIRAVDAAGNVGEPAEVKVKVIRKQA